MSEREEIAEIVAEAIANNYDKLPGNMEDLVEKLRVFIQEVIADLSGSYFTDGKRQALALIGSVWHKLDLHFVIETLDNLAKTGFPIGEEAANLRKRILNARQNV